MVISCLSEFGALKVTQSSFGDTGLHSRVLSETSCTRMKLKIASQGSSMKIRITILHPSTGVQSVHSRYNQCFSILLQLGCERMAMERLRRRGCDPKLLRWANAPEFQLVIIFNEKVLSTRNELWLRATEGPRFVCNDVWLDAQCRDIGDAWSASTHPNERGAQGVDDTRLDVGRCS